MDIKEEWLRKKAGFLLSFFKKTKTPAEFLTIFRIVFGLIVALFFLKNDYLLSLILLTIYQFVLLFDYIDGELARHQKRFSVNWMKMDFLFHYIIPFFFLLFLTTPFKDSNIYIFYIGLLGSIFILISGIFGMRNFSKTINQKEDNKGKLSPVYSFLGIDNPVSIFFILFILNLISISIVFHTLLYFLVAISKRKPPTRV